MENVGLRRPALHMILKGCKWERCKLMGTLGPGAGYELKALQTVCELVAVTGEGLVDMKRQNVKFDLSPLPAYSFTLNMETSNSS
jgi:hypothetical protein